MADGTQALEYPNTIKVLNEFGQAICERYKEGLEEHHHLATYKLYDSVHLHTYSFDGEKMIVSIDLRDYWKFVEAGRGSGKMPPVEKIQEWIEHRPDLFAIGATEEGIPGHYSATPGINQSDAKTSPLAWAIAKKIAREGTEYTPSPVLKETMEETMAAFKERITAALAQDLGSMLSQVVASVWSDVKISKVDGQWTDLEIRDTIIL